MTHVTPVVCLVVVVALGANLPAQNPAPQYNHDEIEVPAASALEARLGAISVEKADTYLEQGALAWSRQRKCIACHTTGSYLRMRPGLSNVLGTPSTEVRDLFTATLKDFKEQSKQDVVPLLNGLKPTQITYLAAGLAEWDAHVGEGKLSDATREALGLMFQVQAADGSWGNLECWPPFESSAYHGTTVAAMAAATAPGWLASVEGDDELQAKIDALRTYLQQTTPPHEYASLLLLWAATRLPGLIDDTKKSELVGLVRGKQQKDGGWSIRTFASPEQWGNGRRAEKLRAETDFNTPESDGHMTGLAVLVLRDAGVSVDDHQLQSAVEWLQSNQRQSGRWWTRSLNTDRYHFITFSGTLYSLAALNKCNALRK